MQEVSLSGDRAAADISAVQGDISTLQSTVGTLSGGGMLPATGLTTGARPLSGYTTGLLADGATVWVGGETNAWFYYSSTTPLAADGINVIQAVGPGKFLNETYRFAQLQTAWFVDPVGGSDTNDGLTALTAIKTDAERQRRVGTLWVISADTSITYLNNVPSTDPVGGELWFAKGGCLRIKGTPTVTYTSGGGGITALTALNRATNTPYSITEAALGAGRVGQRMRMTSGAANGKLAWFVKDLGAGQYRTTPWSSYNTAAATLGVTPTQAAPAPGDTFVLESLTTIGKMKFVVIAQDLSAAPSNGGVPMVLTDIKLTGNAGSNSGGPAISAITQVANLFPVWWGCDMANASCPGVSIACYHTGVTYQLPSIPPLFLGSALVGAQSFQIALNVTIDYDSIVQSPGTFGVRARRGGYVYFGTCGIFDSTGDGVVVEDGVAKGNSGLSGVDAVYGAGNAAYGVRVRPPGNYIYTAKPTLTGATNDSIVGATAKAWGAIPYVDTANNNTAAISANT